MGKGGASAGLDDYIYDDAGGSDCFQVIYFYSKLRVHVYDDAGPNGYIYDDAGGFGTAVCAAAHGADAGWVCHWPRRLHLRRCGWVRAVTAGSFAAVIARGGHTVAAAGPCRPGWVHGCSP